VDILAGCTGFVGGNIAAKHRFDGLYNSANISAAYNTAPDLLVYAGVPAAMFLAEKDPQADMAVIENAAANIRGINPRRLVLVSTVAVLDNPAGVDEDAVIDKGKLSAYGFNRLRLEELARETVTRCHIIRLPALFGQGIKKNFIYDIIHFFPAMLNEAKFNELSAKEPLIAEHYAPAGNGFYELRGGGSTELRAAFNRAGFSALNFTDSRSVFQFYNLARLWSDIETIIKHNIPLLHAATEPASAGEVYEYLTGKAFVNETAKPYNYDCRTKYAALFGGNNGYIASKEQVLPDIRAFAEGQK
jgi:nucleoside-diphosphate-sugar epimerase